MTSRDTLALTSSPSGDGRYMLTQRGFEIRYVAMDVGCFGALGLVAGGAAMMLAGVMGVSWFSEHSPWSPSLWDQLSVASSLGLCLAGFLWVLLVLAGVMLNLRIIGHAGHLLVYPALKPGLHGLCIPITDIQKIDVRRFSQWGARHLPQGVPVFNATRP